MRSIKGKHYLLNEDEAEIVRQALSDEVKSIQAEIDDERSENGEGREVERLTGLQERYRKLLHSLTDE